MTGTQAHIVFNILVLYADANPKDREAFVRYMTDGRAWHEYRFQGCLGFGGKVYFNSISCSVGCYSEDETPERKAVIDRVVGLLALL